MVKIISVAGLCITASLMCKIIEKYNKEQAVITSVSCITVVFMMIFSMMSPVISEINSIFDSGGIKSENIQIIFKSLGISYVTQLASDVCRDCGENSTATAAEISGKVMLLITALPLFRELVSIVSSLL